MAQTKTAGSKSKRTSGRTSSNGSRAKSASRSGSTARKATSTARKKTSSARKKAGDGGGSQGPSAVAKAAQRAKGPAIAGGAALVGLAGGLALNNGKQRKGLAKARPKLNLNLPKPKGSTVKVLGGAAKEIAKGGYKIGQLTSEVQKVRKAVEAQDSSG